MIPFFVVLGVLTFVGVAAGLVLYVMDLPPRQQRYQIEAQAHDTAVRIHERARRAVEEMLDLARREQQGNP